MQTDPALGGETMECPRCYRLVPVPCFPPVPGISGCAPVFRPEVVCMEVTFLCGGCRVNLSVDARWEGRAVECPRCGVHTSVPWWSGRKPIFAPQDAGLSRPPLLSIDEIDFLTAESPSTST